MNKDQVLIEKIRANGKDELGTIYVQHRQEFVGWVLKKYQIGEEQAKDIYQLSILTFYENILNRKLTELTSTVKTYIFAIGRNVALEQTKSKKVFSSSIDTMQVAEDDDSNSDVYEKESQYLRMEQSLIELGEPCKSLLQRYYYENKSMEVLAQVMNYKNSDVVKNQKYKCLQRLRKLYWKRTKGGNL